MIKRLPQSMITTILIPWTEDYRVDEALLRKQVRSASDAGIERIYTFGTAGEGYAVDNEQFREINRIFADEMRQCGREPMAGIITLSASEMVKRIDIGLELGITDFQISFPSWGALTDEEVFDFFHFVCDRFPQCRFMHYNNWGRSRKKLYAAHYERLAREIPNLAAVKYMAGGYKEVKDLMSLDSPIQFFLSEEDFAFGCYFGECSLLLTPLAMNFDAANVYYKACLEKDVDTVIRLQKECDTVVSTLFETCKGQVIDSAYDKVYTAFCHPGFSVRLYPPYRGFSDEQVEAFKKAIRERLPGW